MSTQMTKVLVALSEPCPCGSGKIYSQCCSDKPYEWLTDGDASFYWLALPVYSQQAAKFLKGQIDKLLQRHARQLELDKFIFPGLSPERVTAIAVDVIKRANIEGANIDPALIYATKKTGRMVTEQNKSQLTLGELSEWKKAVNEYRRRVKRGDPPEI